MLVSDNRIARLKPNDTNTESADQHSTDSQAESSRGTIDQALPNHGEGTSVTEGELPPGAMRTSSRQKETTNIWRSCFYEQKKCV